LNENSTSRAERGPKKRGPRKYRKESDVPEETPQKKRDLKRDAKK